MRVRSAVRGVPAGGLSEVGLGRKGPQRREVLERSETERKQGERKEGEGADYWGRGVRGTTARGDAAWSGEGSTGPSGLSERGSGPLSGWRRRARFVGWSRPSGVSRPDRASRGVGPGWPGCCEGWAEVFLF